MDGAPRFPANVERTRLLKSVDSRIWGELFIRPGLEYMMIRHPERYICQTSGRTAQQLIDYYKCDREHSTSLHFRWADLTRAGVPLNHIDIQNIRDSLVRG